MTKFKDSKFGKLLTNRFVKMGIRSIPLIGGPLGNILDDTREGLAKGSEPGSLTGDELTALITSLILGGLLIYALITGDWESAEKGKDFIGN